MLGKVTVDIAFYMSMPGSLVGMLGSVEVPLPRIALAVGVDNLVVAVADGEILEAASIVRVSGVELGLAPLSLDPSVTPV